MAETVIWIIQITEHCEQWWLMMIVGGGETNFTHTRPNPDRDIVLIATEQRLSFASHSYPDTCKFSISLSFTFGTAH